MPNTVIDTTTTPEGTKTAARAHHKIRSMAVSGGFLDGAQLDFADGLNCIIGGRGTGKTTVLEFIRYLLGPMPETSEGKLRGKAIEGLVRGNLGSGTIGLDVETKHGSRYRAERPWDDASQVLDTDGAPVAVSLDRDLVFKADIYIYSQNEIEEIATTPRFQLSLIDKFEEEAIRETGTAIAKLTRAIEQSALDLRLLDRNIGEIEDVVPEIDIVAKRLQEMQAVEGPESELINSAHEHKALRAREAEALADLRQVVDRFADEFERLAGAVAEDCATALGDGFENGPNGAVFAQAADVAAKFTSAMRETVPGCQSAFNIDGVDASSRRHRNVPRWWCDQPPEEEASMEQVNIIGIDLAKRSFQLHGARADGSVAFRRKVSREKFLYFLAALPRCVVAMEACASAHHWGREIMQLGHDVRLVPPIYVKPFVKRQKNDAADAGGRRRRGLGGRLRRVAPNGLPVRVRR